MKTSHALAAPATPGTCAQQACAVELKAGDWTVDVGGIVNACYTAVSCNGDAVGDIIVF